MVAGSHLAIELGETIKLAAPMALTQLGQIAMMATDLAFIGRLGDQAVAAAAKASPPRRPMKARSVVIIAIWPSCCAAIGVASRSVSMSSAMRWPRVVSAADVSIL